MPRKRKNSDFPRRPHPPDVERRLVEAAFRALVPHPRHAQEFIDGAVEAAVDQVGSVDRMTGRTLPPPWIAADIDEYGEPAPRGRPPAASQVIANICGQAFVSITGEQGTVVNNEGGHHTGAFYKLVEEVFAIVGFGSPYNRARVAIQQSGHEPRRPLRRAKL